MKTNRILFMLLLAMGALSTGNLQAQISGKVTEMYLDRYNSNSQGQMLSVLENDYLGTIHYRGWTPANQFQSGAAIRSIVTATPVEGFLPANLIFYTGADELAPRMTITAIGYVGIGTQQPDYPLHVDGDSFIEGDLTVSRSVKADLNLEAGQDIKASQHIFAEGNIWGYNNVFALGKLGVGTTNMPGDERLYVGGGILAESVRVSLQGDWPDFVFRPGYQMPSPAELEAAILEKGHLPGIPSAAQVSAEGINLGEMQALLLQKIEELTLLIIAQQKQIDSLNVRLNSSH